MKEEKRNYLCWDIEKWER